jgi:hypothetical protein
MVCKTTASKRRTGRPALWAACGLATSTLTVSAHGDPLVLRADALAESQSPVGLVVLQGQDKIRPWIDAEGLVWAGAKPSATADVLVLTVRLREPRGFAEARVGRFILTTGAVRPVQLDGGWVIGRAPWGSSLEAFGGAPVVPRFGPRAYDWLVGARLAQSVFSWAKVGVSYVQQRDDGEISNEEVGVDFAAAPTRWFDLAARTAYDLTTPGIAEARASAATRFDAWRVELFAAQTSPSRLLPATSLFSVLGDFPSQTLGSTVKWKAAPRLDILASGAAQAVGDGLASGAAQLGENDLGYNASLRTLLRLDDRGAGSLGLELRRQDVSTAQWTGVRGVATQPLGRGFRFSTEVEIAAPDHPDGHGSVWPWGLMALAWRPTTWWGKGWETAAAVEAASTPVHRYETNALIRLARTLELP